MSHNYKEEVREESDAILESNGWHYEGGGKWRRLSDKEFTLRHEEHVERKLVRIEDEQKRRSQLPWNKLLTFIKKLWKFLR